MGNKPEKPKTGPFDLSTLHKQYSLSYGCLQKNPNFFKQLLTQNTVFATNLLNIFKGINQSFDSYFEMVMFLRRDEFNFVLHKFAIENAPKATLLDRFFMICLGIMDYQSYATRSLSLAEADNLLINYFQLFIAEPEKGTIEKLLKFIKLEGESVNAKQFSSTFREYFPHVQKYLKDYYQLKFNKMEKDGLLMKQFNSKIIKNDAILLGLKIPKLSSPQIVQLYDTQTYGIGFHSIEKKLVGYTGPWMMLVHHIEKDEKGEKENYIFGSYQNGPIKNVLTYQGDLTGFMFSINPNIRFFTTDKGQGQSHFFYIHSIPEQKSKHRKGFGFGGNNQKQQFKLWIDEDLEKSSVFNGKDPTYGYGSLAGPGTDKLSIKRLQVWGLGGKQCVEDQIEYWKQRQQEITKRRKIDKKELLSGNAELFFGNTFAHRDQVVGQIQSSLTKKEEQK